MGKQFICRENILSLIHISEAGGTLAIQGTLDLTGTSSINNGAITGTGSLRILSLIHI